MRRVKTKALSEMARPTLRYLFLQLDPFATYSDVYYKCTDKSCFVDLVVEFHATLAASRRAHRDWLPARRQS